MRCKGVDSGESFEIGYSIEKKRNAARLSEEKQWQATWDRLGKLLTAWTQDGQPIYWLTGDVWTADERKRLEETLASKFDFEIRQTALPKLKQQIEKNSETRLFSPDLALGAPPEKQLEQLHDLLAAQEASASFWLLAFWDTLKEKFPESVRQRLWGGKLPDAETARKFLRGLGLSDTAIVAAFAKLPPRALGAWCAREPFYFVAGDGAALNDVYSSPASCLPPKCWRRFDNARISDQTIAKFIGVSPDLAKSQRFARETFYAAEKNFFDEAPISEATQERAAQVLLKALTGKHDLQFSDGLWWVECNLSLNWDDFKHCLLLPKMSATGREKARHWAERLSSELGKPVWLCLGENQMPANWPGLAITLSASDALRLLHAENSVEAQRLLNRLATEQGKAAAFWNVFQSAGGLGRERIEKHFGGREQELKQLADALAAADQGGNASTLIIGGRRSGKTTLREKIKFEIEREPKEKRRLCLDLNWEGIGDDPNRRGIGLEFWFMNQLKFRFQEQHKIVFEPNWNSAQRDNKTARDQARQRLRELLGKQKEKNQRVPLFIFDETENLLRLDAQSGNPTEPWSLFKFLRELISEKKLVLFATAYPMGLDAQEALNVANFNAASPLYNTFGNTPIMLRAWPPETAWDYLCQRLSGLGVLLPQRYRDEYLNIGRGIPWIAHEFGIRLGKNLPKGRHVIDPQTWQSAKREVLCEILNNLKVSVVRFDLPMPGKTEQQKLSGGKLWQALRMLASARPFVPVENLNAWPTEPIRFTRQELQERLPGVPERTVRELLRRLSSSPVLEGMVSEEDQFVFANNLFPAWLYFSGGRES